MATQRNGMVLAELLSDFLIDSVLGFERAFYRGEIHRNEEYQKLFPKRNPMHDNNFMSVLILETNVSYFNQTWRNLCLRTDLLVNKTWDAFKIGDHSPVCLLNILIQAFVKFQGALNRSTCNFDSLELYSGDIRNQLINQRKELQKHFEIICFHKCTGKKDLFGDDAEAAPFFITSNQIGGLGLTSTKATTWTDFGLANTFTPSTTGTAPTVGTSLATTLFVLPADKKEEKLQKLQKSQESQKSQKSKLPLSGSVCGFCFDRETPKKNCSKCKQVSYCSNICQRKDWPNHRKQCIPF